MALRDVLLRQPDFYSDSPGLYSPWLEPPFAAPSVSPGLGAPPQQRTACDIAELLKARFRPSPTGGKKPREFRWITTCLTSDPTEDTSPRIADWEASASLFVAVDILTHTDGIRHSGLEGQSSSTARSLLVLVACRLQQLLRHPPPNPDLDMGTLAELAESFSFSEIRKRTQQSRFCTVLCDTTSDQDTLLNSGGLVIPLGGISLYVSFSPTMDDTIRTSLPREIRIALRNHKDLFYPGGLVLSVTSSIPLTPPALFQLALLTMLSLHQGDAVPTPTERPRDGSDVVAGRTPQGHAPWLAALLAHSPYDQEDGLRPLPWLTPSLTTEGGTIAWTSSGNKRSINHNTSLSFCPGAVLNGTPQPYLVGAGEVTSPLCTSLILSIACPRVFHSTLHTGSNSMRDFGLHTFPKRVLETLEGAPAATWLAPFRLPQPPQTGVPVPGPLPKNLSIRFGAHRASIYGSTRAAKIMALNPLANDKTRESHAKEVAGSLLRPAILTVEFQEYQKLLDAAEVADTPFTLPDMPPPPPTVTPSISGRKRRGDGRSDDENEDTAASGALARHASQTPGQASGSTGPPATPIGATPASTRTEAMAAFLKDPLIDPDHMAVEHITTRMALLLLDPIHAVAVSLHCAGYTPEIAAYIWSEWEANFQLPSTHPWAAGTRAKDNILAMLQMVYTDPNFAARDIQGLTDLVASAIPTESFILYTVITLRDNDMVTSTPSPHHCQHDSISPRGPTLSAPLASPPSPGYLRGHIVTATSGPIAHQSVAPTC